MAEVMQGGLNQMNPAAAVAGGGDPMQTQLFQQMMETGQKKQSYLEQQQAAYNADMDKYAQMVQQSQQPDSREALMWGNMAGAAASVAPTWGNIGAMLGKTGEAYGKSQEYDQQMNLRNQSELTKMRQAEVRALESKDQMTSLYKALYGGPANKPMTPEQLRTVYTGARNEAAQIAKDYDWKSAEERAAWIEDYATKAVNEYRTKFGLNTGATYGSGTSPAPRQTQSDQVPQEGIGAGSSGEGSVEVTPGVAGQLSQQDAELASRLIARINANPAAAKADTARLEQLLMKYQTGAPVQTVEIAPVKRDKALEGAKLDSSKEGAKMYAKSFEESVLAPLQAFQDTGKIMQDFNNLGEMQSALKNGKLKEFMAGETGKWAMSMLPEKSDLRKGIANAQEAEKLTSGMVNKILMAAKGVQTEGDAQRARQQVTSVGIDPDANKYMEAYINETARQLKLREQHGLAHKKSTGNWEGYDDAWQNSPIMKEAKGSVKKIGTTWVGLTQYIDKFKAKNQGATDSDAIAAWNRVK